MKSKGFTLIELLVVVAIIGVLATVVLSSLNSARVKARDARRDADIKNIQTALELYHLDNGQYPHQAQWLGVAPNGAWANSGNTSWETLENTMGTTLPRDPVNIVPTTANDWPGDASRRFNYVYTARGISTGCPNDGQAYKLVYHHESGDTASADSPGLVTCDGSISKQGNGSITVGMSPRS